jgi:hypothetical protein
MRTLIDHIVDADLPQNQIRVEVQDGPGPGGACHVYYVSGAGFEAFVNFQKGPIKEAGVNGLTHEALLAILIDRLRSFQKGPFPSRENAIALTHLEEALMWLHQRTRDRLRRGVEGKTLA